MGNEQEGQTELLPQLVQQVNYLSLNRYVQRRTQARRR